MLGVASFTVSIIGVLLTFLEGYRLPAFAIGIMGIIIAVISAYYKDKKELGDKAKKDSRALEVGSIIIAGATCISYFLYLIIDKI